MDTRKQWHVSGYFAGGHHRNLSFYDSTMSVQRLASVFLDKFVSKDAVTKRYVDAMGSGFALDELSFAEFSESLHRPAVRNANHHWRPQVDFLLYDQYHDVFSVERFSNAVKNSMID